METGPRALFSAFSSAPRFWAALSEALFSALSLAGASCDSCHSRNPVEVELVGSEETDLPCVTECMEIRDAKGEGDGKEEDEDDKSKVKVEAARKEDEVEKRQDLEEELEEEKRGVPLHDNDRKQAEEGKQNVSKVEEEEEGEEEEPRKEVEDAEAAETQVQALDASIMSSRPLLEKATPEELKPSPSEHDACCEDRERRCLEKACGRVEMEPFVLLAFLSPLLCSFCQFEANPCDEAKCGLVGMFLSLAFQCFRVLQPKIHHLPVFDLQNGACCTPKHYVLKGHAQNQI